MRCSSGSVSPGAAPRPYTTRVDQRRNEGRDQRTHYAPGLLFWMAHGGNGGRHRKERVRRTELGPAARLETYDNQPVPSLVGLFKDKVTVFRPTHRPIRRYYHGCVGLFDYQWPCFEACNVRTDEDSRL